MGIRRVVPEEPEKDMMSLFELINNIVKSDGDLLPPSSFMTFLITVRDA